MVDYCPRPKAEGNSPPGHPRHRGAMVYSYFMLQQAIVQNIFPEVQVPTWQAIARGEVEGNSMSSRYLHRGENVLHYCLIKLEITVLLPNYSYSHVTYHVTRQ